MSTENKDTTSSTKLLDKPEGKANVLILGGCGFIGRHLVKYLVDNKLASFIKVADKQLPATSYLSEEHKAAFDQTKICDFKHSDLSKDDHVARLFKDVKYNYVINLCGETRFGLSEDDYKLKCFTTATKCAAAAKKNEVPKWIEVSTAQVYEAQGKKPSGEEAKLKPWTIQAQYRLKAEEVVVKEGPPAVILRPAIVFGPGDLTGVAPRLACGAVYKKLNEKIKFLWDEKLKINVVHVRDVVAAIWTACTDLKPGTTYNLADESDLDQGKFNEYIGTLFNIKTGFQGIIISNAAKLNMSGAAAHSNDKHVPTWTKVCQENKVLNTPISPYIDKELLYNNNLFIDGTKITKDSSFKYKEKCNLDLVKEQLQAAIKQNIFPNVL
jgi:nucleoside-diphosphate-sugar epimerase